MARSSAATVSAYLETLAPDRREVVAAVRNVILANLPEGYEETMNWGGICYEIPLSAYPKTYNKQPLTYAALAAQKNYYALYLMGSYVGANPQDVLRAQFEARGKKLDMGKSCVRFKKLEDLPLDVIGNAIASKPPAEYIKYFEATRPK